MSKTNVLIVAVTSWLAAGNVPLRAQAQMVADGAGVTVNLNGAQLMHRTPVNYPADALAAMDVDPAHRRLPDDSVGLALSALTCGQLSI